MPEMEIVPYERFGPVRFGASEEQVIDVIGNPDSVLPKPATGSRELHYDELRIHVMIDAENSCKSVESVEPEFCVPIINTDLRLMGDVERLVEALEQRGFEIRQGAEHTVLLCDALGVSLWREFSHKAEIDSVCAFRQDVYKRVTDLKP